MSEKTIELSLMLIEDGADYQRLEELTIAYLNNLQEFDLDYLQRKHRLDPQQIGAKGDPVTVGGIILGVSTAAIPALFAFFQNWVSQRRRIVVEAPNGAKVEFIPEKYYSEADIIDLVKKLSDIPSQPN
jgi:hypothetical protein